MPIFYPMLTPHNYTTWTLKTEVILDTQEVWEAIKPTRRLEVDVKKDKKVCVFILQCILEDVLLQIAKKKTAREIWDSLKTRYLGSDRVKMAQVRILKSEFNVLRKKETETIHEFAGKISKFARKFTTLRVALEDSSLVKKLLDSVSDKYLPIVTRIEQSQDLETMLFEETIGRMMVYEE